MPRCRGAHSRSQCHAGIGGVLRAQGELPEVLAEYRAALAIAERLADTEYQLRALWGLWHFHASRGECRRALALAERFRDRAAADRAVGERMVGASLHYLGDQTNARQHVERMLGRYADPVRRSHTIRFQYDQKIAAHMILARILWLQGFPERARRIARKNVEDARAIDHALSLCNALEVPCLVEIWSGDLEAAERAVTALLDHSARHALAVRHAGARCFDGALLIERGAAGRGLELIRTAVDELRETSFVPYYPITLGTLARGLARVGQVARALATIDQALAKSERDEERWWIAELLRIKADLIVQAGGPGAAPAAEEQLQQGLEWARRQGALSMELRCATGLARRWLEQGRTEAARELLAPVYSRFTEGFDTADLQAAEALLGRFGKG